ncbi:MAG: efflux RND transporter periplasmic adaptor subunit [Alphaproteobacteria bacterium]
MNLTCPPPGPILFISRKVLTVGAPLLVFALTILSFIGLNANRPQPEKREVEERPVSAFVAIAKRMTVVPKVVTQGEVRPLREIDLVPQVGGRIEEIDPDFEPGGAFEKGELLFRIQEADYRLAVVRAQSRVAEARQNLLRENAEAEMAQRDWEELGEGEASPLTLRKPQLETRKALLQAAEADLAEAELALRRTRITAPFDGRVREKRADIGQVVGPQTILGRIFSSEVVQIPLPLTDRELGVVGLPIGYDALEREGPPVILTATVAGEMRQWRGTIARTESAIDPQTRVLSAICEVVDPYGAHADNGVPLAVGLFVTAEIPGRPVEDVIVVPRAALRSADTVYVVKPDDAGIDRLEFRVVQVAFTEAERVILSGGLEPGERVVVSAIEGAVQGLRINALDETNPDGVGEDTQP